MFRSIGSPILERYSMISFWILELGYRIRIHVDIFATIYINEYLFSMENYGILNGLIRFFLIVRFGSPQHGSETLNPNILRRKMIRNYLVNANKSWVWFFCLVPRTIFEIFDQHPLKKLSPKSYLYLIIPIYTPGV